MSCCKEGCTWACSAEEKIDALEKTVAKLKEGIKLVHDQYMAGDGRYSDAEIVAFMRRELSHLLYIKLDGAPMFRHRPRKE